jgi:protein arginine phosphatase
MNVLFVDESDTCLAPMACGFLREAIKVQDDIDVQVDSAGLCAFDDAASNQAIAVMKEHNVDLTGHRPKALSADLVHWADLILTVSGEQLRQLCHTYPEANGKSFRLTTYVDVRDDVRADLYGGAAWMYEEASDVLLLSLIKLAPKLGLSAQSLPDLPDVDPGDDEPSFQPWRTEPPTPRTRSAKVGLYEGMRLQSEERAIARCYEAQYRLRRSDFRSVEEYRDLRDDVDEGEWVLECWRLGGELTPPANPYGGTG